MSKYSGYNGKDEDHKLDSVIKLEKEELKRIRDMIDTENMSMSKLAETSLAWKRAASAADEVRNARDQYCLHIEKKYNITPGAQWRIDFDSCGIIVAPTNPIVNVTRKED